MRCLLLTALLVGLLALGARADDAPEPARVEGTIVSLRGNILVIRPSLRPVMTRVAIGGATQVIGQDRASKAMLKPGMRIAVGGQYSEQGGFSPRWIECADKPMGMLARKTEGFQTQPGGGFAMAGGTLKSVSPFVWTDDAGKERTAGLDKLRGVWKDRPIERTGLLIGTRVNCEGRKMPDGVIEATAVYPGRSFSKTGTMFGTIVGASGNTVTIRPRYTTDTLTVTRTPACTLQRQLALDADTIHVGSRVTFWAERRNPQISPGNATDLKAIALLVGPGRYPTSQGDNAPQFYTGTLASLDPVRLAFGDRATCRVLIPAQMPIARLVPIRVGELKRGAKAMFVLSRKPDGSLETSAIILDASPWVGYGG